MPAKENKEYTHTEERGRDRDRQRLTDRSKPLRVTGWRSARWSNLSTQSCGSGTGFPNYTPELVNRGSRLVVLVDLKLRIVLGAAATISYVSNTNTVTKRQVSARTVTKTAV